MTTIITRNSTLAGAQPAPGTVEIGELCVNVADGKLFSSPDGNTIIPIGSSGSGTTLPAGTVSGQTLNWIQDGVPGWNVSDALKVFAGPAFNVSIGGAPYSDSYKLTVRGNAYVVGSLVADNCWLGPIICQGALTTLAQASDANSFTRKDYVDGLNASNVKTSGAQTIGGAKTFTSNVTHSSSTTLTLPANVSVANLADNASRYPITWGLNAMVKGSYQIPTVLMIRNTLLAIGQAAGLTVSAVETILAANDMAPNQL